MNVLSLFSGIGGLDLGLQRAGMTIVGQVEIDPWCRKVLAKHWPEVPRHDDVRTCAEWWGRGPVDLVAGGFPCQPVSWAGKGLAQDDERWLWPAFAGVVRALRPAYILMENVPGLLGRGMGDVLGDLATCGYDAEWDCIPAAGVGAPHLRDRVWIVAYPASGHGRAHATPVSGDGKRQLARQAGERGSRGPSGGSRAPGVLADSTGDRWPPQGQRAPAGHLDWRGQLRPQPAAHWDVEPSMGRVADGVPDRLDRLRGLGNAVVPQVAEHIGRMIMEAAA